MYFDPMKPHCLECPYKPPLEREKVGEIEEPQGEAKERALRDLFEEMRENDRMIARQYGIF